MAIVNISCYKFTPLQDLKELRERLMVLCKDWKLKGTILLSTEGINLFVAGERSMIDALVTELRSLPGLEDLQPKYSESADQPFRRMLVRIKKEIIAFGVEGIDPGKRTSPKLKPQELKQWLDEGRPITLLDTRNDYEVELGTFRGALIPHIDHFRDFPAAVRAMPEEMKEQPIVMFCTGGIRCEKAGPFMEREGFKTIYQLDGGILKYFEECGGAHYDGECFVFDQRVGLDSHLGESETTQCYRCQAPLSLEDQQSPHYVVGKVCPHCYKDPSTLMAETLVKRAADLRRVTSPLPGSVAYDNYRPLNVSADYDGGTLMEFLTGCFAHHPPERWMKLFDAGELRDLENRPASPNQIVRAGERFHQFLPKLIEPAVNANVEFLHEDASLIVLNKPAPLPMHPGGRFNRNTLQYFLNEIYHPDKPRPVHRLDANTSGLLVMARTKHVASLIQPQFIRGEVEKVYLAVVQGHPVEDAFVSDAAISDDAERLGSRLPHEEGQTARTEFRVIERREDGTTLLEARPITGRTNQIRIHLWQLGYPILNDPTYLPNGVLGDQQTQTVEDAPMHLHAWKLAFRHPLTNEKMRFEVPAPWLQTVATNPAADPVH